MNQEGEEPVSSPPVPNVQPATETAAAAAATQPTDPESNTSNTPNVQPATETAITAATQATDPESNTSNNVVASVLRQWKRETLLEKSMLALRALCLLFSFISFVIMASNKHGKGENFDNYQEYQYCLAAAILAFLYTLCQVVYQVYKLSSEKFLIPRRAMSILDFVGDQVTAYLLISASSAAIPLINRMREFMFNSFTDSTACSISLAFLAFLSIGLSALISGYRLSTQTYI